MNAPTEMPAPLNFTDNAASKVKELIAKHNEHLLTEQRVAKAVFDKVAHSGCLSAPNIRYLQSPFALFNGDLLLAAFKPSGGMHVLLGDFTGHGLPAAIGGQRGGDGDSDSLLLGGVDAGEARRYPAAAGEGDPQL